jgi:SAM-dependent methyltransferase
MVTNLIPIQFKRWVLYRLPVLLSTETRHVRYEAFQASDDAHYARFVASQRNGDAKKVLLDWLAADPLLNGDSFSLLDVGCGPGALYSMIQDDAVLRPRVRYSGVDQAEGAVRYADRTFPDARFFCRDVLRDGLPDEPFDVIAINEVVEHLSHYRPLLQLAAARKPKILVLCTFAAIPEYRRDRRLWRPDTRCYMNSYAAGPLQSFLRNEIAGELRTADFGTHEPQRYWFPKKAEILWYLRRPGEVASSST